uniref:hypothetical protein n=1 Tax=Saccharicrinis carchari TaxID=1168039 RepID=UPI001C8F511C
IPNREVKPVSADGTAEMWESRSPPIFKKSNRKLISVALFLFERLCISFKKGRYGVVRVKLM